MTQGIWIVLILCLMFSIEGVVPGLKGDHICEEVERYKVNITSYVLKNVTVRSYSWCYQIPPRCSTYTVQQINDTKTEEEDKIRYVMKCCEGYYEVDAEGPCLPNSCKSCVHGKCDRTGVCHCDLGYWGSNCDEECTGNNWDTYCQNKCTDCIEGHCNSSTGNCTCPPKSIRCDPVCSEGQRNGECFDYCKCDTMTVCDPFTMKCTNVNSDYLTQYNDYEDFSNYKLLKNKIRHPTLSKFHSDIATSVVIPIQTTENPPGNYFTTETVEDTTRIITNTIIPSQIVTENKQQEITSTEILEINTNHELAELNSTTAKIPNTKGSVEVLESKTKEEMNPMHSSNESSSHRIVIDSHLFVTIIAAVLSTVLIILSAAVFCVLYKLKEKRKKYVGGNQEDEKIRKSLSSVSVTTRSIFHTPLPDPPIFENPAFSTQFECKQHDTFETHVICNMNIPKVASFINPKEADNPELFYDHPPSTGSYRAASILEPQSFDSIKSGFDPIYDEIPCNARMVPVTTPPPSYSSEQSTLYMNTK